MYADGNKFKKVPSESISVNFNDYCLFIQRCCKLIFGFEKYSYSVRTYLSFTYICGIIFIFIAIYIIRCILLFRCKIVFDNLYLYSLILINLNTKRCLLFGLFLVALQSGWKNLFYADSYTDIHRHFLAQI